MLVNKIDECLRNNALLFLNELTQEYLTKPRGRTEKLLPTETPTVYTDRPQNIGDGWAYSIGGHTLASLDTALTTIKNKETEKDELVWTQGSAFNFAVGYTFHSAEGFPKTCIQVKRTIAAVPATFRTDKYEQHPQLPQSDEEAGLLVKLEFKERATKFPWVATTQTRRDPGFIELAVYIPDVEKPWKFYKTVETTQDGLVRILISGCTF